MFRRVARLRWMAFAIARRSPWTSVTPALCMATSVPVPIAMPTSASARALGDGIDKILIDRTTREGFNKSHALRANHFKVFAHAGLWSHPGMKRVKPLLCGGIDGTVRMMGVGLVSFGYEPEAVVEQILAGELDPYGHPLEPGALAKWERLRPNWRAARATRSNSEPPSTEAETIPDWGSFRMCPFPGIDRQTH